MVYSPLTVFWKFSHYYLHVACLTCAAFSRISAEPTVDPDDPAMKKQLENTFLERFFSVGLQAHVRKSQFSTE
jgi:hypothetical protein